MLPFRVLLVFCLSSFLAGKVSLAEPVISLAEAKAAVQNAPTGRNATEAKIAELQKRIGTTHGATAPLFVQLG